MIESFIQICDAVCCCSVLLQCVAVCCSVLQCVARIHRYVNESRSILHISKSVLQCVALIHRCVNELQTTSHIPNSRANSGFR